MYKLKVSVKKVLGECTASPPMKPGDHFTVCNGDIRIPEGGYICVWALQSLMPLITPKEREIAEKRDEDWMWRVHLVQCPDPKGRVIYKIERVGPAGKDNGGMPPGEGSKDSGSAPESGTGSGENGLKDLRVEVESGKGHCTSGMKPGDRITLRSGRLYLPAGAHFCLYALQAVLPLLPAKQRMLRDGDWLKDECRVICPDPAGNVVLRIDEIDGAEG